MGSNHTRGKIGFHISSSRADTKGLELHSCVFFFLLLLQLQRFYHYWEEIMQHLLGMKSDNKIASFLKISSKAIGKEQRLQILIFCFKLLTDKFQLYSCQKQDKTQNLLFPHISNNHLSVGAFYY